MWPKVSLNAPADIVSVRQDLSLILGCKSTILSRADRELYAGLAHATLCFLKADLTLEPSDIQEAVASINRSFEVSNQQRRKSSTASMMMRLIYRPNYNAYSDDQCHAELVHAESLLLLALISFVSDQSLLCLVKGALRIRTCYQRYKECQYILETRKTWSSEEAKRHFESGVRLGHGIFNLLMSYLPRRVLRFLEYVGFSGNRQIGIEELDRSVELMDGLRSVFSALVILTYQTYIESLFGLGSYDSKKVKHLKDSFLGQYPNSAFFLLFQGRYHQMAGELDKAIESFELCVKAQDDWKQFHSICHWEIMWCHAVQMDWIKAANYADLLRKSSKWSQASYTYQYGTFLYSQLVEDERAGRCKVESEEHTRRLQEVRAIIEQVPELRIRYAGKTIPAEKFAITRSAKFLKQKNRLSLPALEFLYVWNIFTILKNSPAQVEKLLDRVEQEISYIETKLEVQNRSDNNKDTVNEEEEEEEEEREEDAKSEDEQTDHWIEDLCFMFLLKGMCLKQLKRLDEAELSFDKILDYEDQIKVDTFLVPHTLMELAVLKLDKDDYVKTRELAKKARNDYTGYLLETMVHFRLHAANRIARQEQQNELANSSTGSNGSQSAA